VACRAVPRAPERLRLRLAVRLRRPSLRWPPGECGTVVAGRSPKLFEQGGTPSAAEPQIDSAPRP